ncbi:MAG: cobalamin biosynthesis protein CobQ [Pseudomonadota bacterium]
MRIEPAATKLRDVNTLTHILAAAAALARPGEPTRNYAALVGALAPDISIFVFYGWTKFTTSLTERQIWREAYWTEPWQIIGAISNSVPLAAALLAAGVIAKARMLILFAGAMLIHTAMDFPVHADDAHRHFWPVTDWRFHSPVSYWDASRHVAVGAGLELAVVALSTMFLWRRFRAVWVRAMAAVAFSLQALAFGFAVVSSAG